MSTRTTPCVCGNMEIKPWTTVDGIDIVACATCGVRRVYQIPADYRKQYEAGTYHAADRSLDTGHPAHPERFEHDYQVALARVGRMLHRFDDQIGPTLLDVGCSNGAFVQAACDKGFDAIGCDLSIAAVPLTLKDCVRRGDLENIGLARRTLDIITMNDVIEHLEDPVTSLRAAKGLLKRDGILVIDTPDMGSELARGQGAGFKHIKPKEHLWYFTSGQLRSLLERLGFFVVWMDSPIPGKVTAYATPQSVVENVTVYGPPGVGDILWTLTKLRCIREREAPCRIQYVVCVKADDPKVATRGKDFLDLCGLIDSCAFQEIGLPPDAGCLDVKEPVYHLIANDHLEVPARPDGGKRLELWRPEIDTSWDVEINVPPTALNQADLRLAGVDRHAVLYFSSNVWNHVCVNNQAWTSKEWAALVLKLRNAGIKPVILGCDWDKGFVEEIAEHIVATGAILGETWINLVGRTPLPLAMAFMQRAEITIGIAAGLPMIAAHMGWKTIIFWPEKGVLPHRTQMEFHKEFQTNWLSPEVLTSATYVPLSFGKFNVDDVLTLALAAPGRDRVWCDATDSERVTA